MKKLLFEGKRKIIGIPLVVILSIFLWPFLIGGLLVYFAAKKIELKGLKYTIISIVLFFSLLFGSAWVAAVKSPTPSPEVTNGEVAGEQTAENTPTATAIPTEKPTDTPTPTQAPTKTPTPTKTIPTPTKYIVPTAIPTIPPTAIPTQIIIQPTQPPVQQGGGFSCNCSKTCTQISSCAEAQYLLNSCGCSARDGDNDGIACDGAPLNCQN